MIFQIKCKKMLKKIELYIISELSYKKGEGKNMTSSELKLKAKEQLQGKKLNAALMILVVVLIEGILSTVISKIFPGESMVYEGIKVTSSSPIGSIIETFVTVFLGLGMTSYYMKIARGEEASISDLFSKGNILLKAFVTSILTGLAVFGGTLLLIVPGILLAFGYSMINYIYIDNPEIGMVEVMKKSREMMKGHKWQYFCLSLSFIGWAILGVFTVGILYFWLLPYIGVAQVNFYESIKED